MYICIYIYTHIYIYIYIERERERLRERDRDVDAIDDLLRAVLLDAVLVAEPRDVLAAHHGGLYKRTYSIITHMYVL